MLAKHPSLLYQSFSLLSIQTLGKASVAPNEWKPGPGTPDAVGSIKYGHVRDESESPPKSKPNHPNDLTVTESGWEKSTVEKKVSIHATVLVTVSTQHMMSISDI